MYSKTTPKIILCADDYALSPGVSRGIRELIQVQKITATSAMSISPYWSDESRSLREISDTHKVDVGLHLTLTDLKGLTSSKKLPTINKLLVLAMLRKLPLKDIECELSAQFDAFVKCFGKLPAFLDGHQHIHILPGIRDIVIGLYKKHLVNTDAYIRNCSEKLMVILKRNVSIPKTILISTLSKRLKQRLLDQNIPTNSGFAGIYDFDLSASRYKDIFARFLINAQDKTLIMCHPGYTDDILSNIDSVTLSREKELEFFLSLHC